MVGGALGQSAERNLSWLDGSVPADLSADGSRLLFSEIGDGRRAPAASTRGGRTARPPCAWARALLRPLADGKWALASQGPTSRPVLLPMGAGRPRELPFAGIGLVGGHACFFPDGKRTLFWVRAGHEGRLFVLDIETGKARAVGPRRARPIAFGLSPDGKLVVCSRKGVAWELYDVEGGAGRAVPGLPKDLEPIQWCADGRVSSCKRGVLPPSGYISSRSRRVGWSSGRSSRFPPFASPTGRRVFLRPTGSPTYTAIACTTRTSSSPRG